MREPDKSSRQRWWEQLRQDVQVLALLFPWRVAGALIGGIAVAAVLYRLVYNRIIWPPISYVKALYAILNMMLFQIAYTDIPETPALDPFFIIVPLIGFPILLVFGANILNILRIFFVRGDRGQDWQKARVQTIERPILICGLDHLGYRIAERFLDWGRPVVAIAEAPTPLVTELLDRGLPVIYGDVRNVDVLQCAGAERAQTVLVCTSHDLVNLEVVYHIRALNRGAPIVLRLFEDEIADEIQRSFDVKAIVSRSQVASQTFAHAAIGLEVLETFTLRYRTYVLAKLPLREPLLRDGATVGALADRWDMSIVALHRADRLWMEPAVTMTLQAKDVLFVFTPVERLTALLRAEGMASALLPLSPPVSEAPVLVCGLGHTGYRIVNALEAMDYSVVGLAFAPDRLSQRLEEEGLAMMYGDFRRPSMLEEAGVHQARALIACDEDDMVNFETTLRARELRADLRVVMRMFEATLGEELQRTFDIDAVYSTSALAAPAFVAAALDIHVAQSVLVGEQRLFIARIQIKPLSRLLGDHTGALTDEQDLTVLLHARGETIQVPPGPDQRLAPGDEIVVLASEAKLRDLGRRSRTSREI